MNSKHYRTLAAVFGHPIPKTMPFRHVESLLRSIGCAVIEKDGSAVTFVRDGLRVSLHRPHPEKTTREYQIKAVRDFLMSIGVEP